MLANNCDKFCTQHKPTYLCTQPNTTNWKISNQLLANQIASWIQTNQSDGCVCSYSVELWKRAVPIHVWDMHARTLLRLSTVFINRNDICIRFEYRELSHKFFTSYIKCILYILKLIMLFNSLRSPAILFVTSNFVRVSIQMSNSNWTGTSLYKHITWVLIKFLIVYRSLINFLVWSFSGSWKV